MIDPRAAWPRDAEPMLRALVRTLAGNPQITQVQIAGFADDAGGSAANTALALRRARAVRSALVTRGVDPARLLVHGWGTTAPPCDPPGSCVWPPRGVGFRVISTVDGPVAPEQ